MPYTAKDIETYVCAGDYIKDPMGGDYREIASFEVHSEEIVRVNMTDGGVMGLSEINDGMIFLESEVR